MTNSTRLEIEWLNHIQSEFPRRVNTPKSEVVYTSERYLHIIWRHLLLSPIWVGVYPYEYVQDSMFDKFFFDLDHETDLESVHMDTITLYNHFKQKFGRESRLYFSAGKGFHVYLDFHPLKTGIEMFQDTLKSFVETTKEETGVTTIDRHCIDPNRVARLPFTPHEKSRRWCIPIRPEWDLKEVLRESIYMNDCWNIDTEPRGDEETALNLLKWIRKSYDEAKERKIIPQEYVHLDSEEITIEIEVLRELAPFVEDGRHRILHYMIVPRMVHAGYNIYQIHTFCKEWTERSGKRYHTYQDYVDRSYYRNQKWNAWSFNKFFYEYPELAQPLIEVLGEVKKNVNKREEGN